MVIANLLQGLLVLILAWVKPSQAAGLLGILAREIGTQTAFMISGFVAIVSGSGILWSQYRQTNYKTIVE